MSGVFGLGWKVLKAFAKEQSAMKWYQAKLVPEMFKPGELEVFEWMQSFVTKHHAVPHVETLEGNFPDMKMYPVPEPASFYMEKLENRLYHEVINKANIESQSILKANQDHHAEAAQVMSTALAYLKQQQYRMRIVDLAKEGPSMVIQAYHDVMMMENVGQFGWGTMDKSSGGIMPGDVVSIIGRPAAGKTWLICYGAMHNWRKGKRILLVSMEMAPLPMVQRLSAMFANTNIGQLKVGGYSSQTYKKFAASLIQMAQKEDGFFVVDGNLAASVEDIYSLASQLKCDQIWVDGAYLLKHPNKRLDRFARITENIELIKQSTTSASLPTIASYQFNRNATKDKKKGQGDTATMDDVYGSDAIAQISSIMLGLFQDDSVETLEGRMVRVLKGRNGEMGQFKINWDFNVMNFAEVSDEEEGHKEKSPLDYI